jgi:hypothetical protein
MRREVHVRFCERPEVQLPGPTLPHICGKKGSNGRFTVLRPTISQTVAAKLSEVKVELKRRLHDPIPEVGRWLRSVVGGHIRYYGVPTNGAALYTFRFQVGRALAPHPLAAQPDPPRALGSDAAPAGSLVASRPPLSSVFPAPHGRYYLR